MVFAVLMLDLPANAATRPAPPPATVSAPQGCPILIVPVGGLPRPLDRVAVDHLATVSVPIGSTPHAPQASGKLLWQILTLDNVLGLIDPRHLAPLVVLVTGRDGYTAALAVAEIAPAFQNKQVILASGIAGKNFPGGQWRLIVPGDAAAARSVRDVARITVRLALP